MIHAEDKSICLECFSSASKILRVNKIVIEVNVMIAIIRGSDID